MATTAFIRFDGIDGESTNKDHRGEIDLLSWSWGLNAVTVTSGGGGSGASRVAPRDFHFVHRYDKASPALAKSAASGRHVASAVMSSRKAGAGQKDFLKVTMTDVLITSVATGDDGSGPTEQVSITYAEIAFSYQPAGTGAAAVTFDWNVASGRVT